jgi:hypothetical protein
MTTLKFQPITTGPHTGYRTADGRGEVTDNGGGMGSSHGSGRWAVVIDGKWIANVDRLADAKTMVADLLSR